MDLRKGFISLAEDVRKSVHGERRFWRNVLLLFLSTRAALVLAGVVSRIIIGPFHKKILRLADTFSPRLWLDMWGAWDTEWYMHIAENWYTPVLNRWGEANYTFFPLYPTLMRLVGGVIGNYYVAGLLISNLSFFAACFLLYKLVRLDFDGPTALNSVKYLFLFPEAFMLSGVLTESLSLALILSCFYCGRKGRWLVAGFSGFLLSLTKAVGFIIFLPLLFEYMRGKNYRIGRVRADVLFLLLIPFGLAVFSAYNYYLMGDFLGFTRTQYAWGARPSNPVATILTSLSSDSLINVFQAASAVVFLLVLLASFRKVRFSYWLFGLLWILAPLCTGVVTSMLRYVMLVFPFYILFAGLARDSELDQNLTVVMALLQGSFIVLWANYFFFIV